MITYSVVGLETQPGSSSQFAIPNVNSSYFLQDGGPNGSASFQPLPAATPPVQSSATRSLNSPFQLSTTRFALVFYSTDIACTSTLTGGQTGTVYLEICASSGFSSGVQTLSSFTNGNSVSLAIAITVVQTNTASLSGLVPPGYYARLRTANISGTPTFTYRVGQEVLL